MIIIMKKKTIPDNEWLMIPILYSYKKKNHQTLIILFSMVALSSFLCVHTLTTYGFSQYIRKLTDYFLLAKIYCQLIIIINMIC